MIVSLCQMNMVWENKEANILKVKAFAKEAAAKNSDIILFPEMSLTGFSMNIENTKEKDESVEEIKKIAAENNIYIGIGWTRDCGDKAENVYTIVDNSGKVAAEYTKIHPFSYSGEDKYFNGGNSLASFEYKGFNIGILICYDLRFPEIFQALSKKSDLIILPACWPEKRSEHWKSLLKARAIENQCYIAGINCVGNIGDLSYLGDSCIIDPNGGVIEAVSHKEAVITREIINNTLEYRNSFPVKKDRKISLYKELI